VAKCKSCGAEIVWAKTRSGKNMPMDPKPERLLVQVDREASGTASWPVVEVREVWRPHWATCPDATEHRRRL